MMTIKRGGYRSLVLMSMLTVLYSVLGDPVAFCAPIGTQNMLQENVADQTRSTRVQRIDNVGRLCAMSESPSDVRQSNNQVENMRTYGYQPIRALQIPGHVLEVITRNLGTEFITID